MKKTIYLKTQKEVSIGDLTDLNGHNVTLTEQLVKDLPNMFEVREATPEYVECIKESSFYTAGCIYPVERNGDRLNIIDDDLSDHGWTTEVKFNLYFKPSTKEAYDRQELLKKAREDYKIGTVIKDILREKITITSYDNDPYFKQLDNGDIWFNNGNAKIYENGKWAEILKPILTSEDGIELYEGDRYWLVLTHEKDKWHGFENYSIRHKTTYLIGCTDKLADWNKDGTYLFSTKEAAEKWIEENRPKGKTLEDYEREFLEIKSREYNGDTSCLNHILVYGDLKILNPKAYYQIIMQRIADDLNDGSGTFKIVLDGDNYKIIHNCTNNNDATTKWSSEEVAEKAIKIMGNKLDVIFK